MEGGGSEMERCVTTASRSSGLPNAGGGIRSRSANIASIMMKNWQKALWASEEGSERLSDRLQDGRRLLVPLGKSVDEIECHCRSLQPLSTIINRPHAVGLRKLKIDECLNEWILIRLFASIASICALFDKSEE